MGGLLALGTAAAGGGSALVYAYTVEPQKIELVEQTIPLPGLAVGLSGLRAAQISDLHMGAWTSRELLERVVAAILAQKPDLVFITGDYLTTGGDLDRALADLLAALSGLSQQVPVYTVMGNHDHQAGESELRGLLADLGIQELANTIQPFRRGGDLLYIAGLDSVSTGHQRLDILDREAPTDAPIILMAHEPDMADYSAATGKFVLQISGHSHGGQVRLPLVGPLVLPWMGRKYPAGLYKIHGMQQYTNRGIGMIDVPLRLNCPPEITLFTFISSRW